MKHEILFAFLFSSPVLLNAMQHDQLFFEDVPVTFQIQVPCPINQDLKEVVDLANEKAVVKYLKALKDPDEIPFSMYDIIIEKFKSNSVSKKFSDVLLAIWGINPDILVSGREEIMKSKGETLSDVKNSR